jgi:hypothetical protein
MVIASIGIWRRLTGSGMRWFLVGLAVYTVGVGLKFLFADLFLDSHLAAMKAHWPFLAYLIVGSLYGGLLTGVFEDGVTLVAGMKWRSLAAQGSRAVAVGIGAGAFEALTMLWAGLLLILVIIFGMNETLDAETVAALRDPTTAVAWLLQPLERAGALLAHISSRVLALLTVATGRWRYFLYGLLLSTGIDGVAMYFDLSGQLEKVSTWWIELALSPFFLLPILLIPWCLRRWPRVTVIRSGHVPAVGG